MKQKQFTLVNHYKKEFGGSLLEGVRKGKRPLCSKRAMHLVLKANHKKYFNPKYFEVVLLFKKIAKENNIKVYDLSHQYLAFAPSLRYLNGESSFLLLKTTFGSTIWKQLEQAQLSFQKIKDDDKQWCQSSLDVLLKLSN